MPADAADADVIGTAAPRARAADPRAAEPRAHPSPATDAAAALLARLVARGVRHIVLAPGSRSQALALVAAALEDAGLVRLHVRLDERVAGFTALGIGRESGMPAAVVCTSGTATANLMPAVMEADHAGVPLLLLTADRPPELRGVGANQATRQPGMYADRVRAAFDLPTPDACDADGTDGGAIRAVADDAIAAALGGGRRPGPVHVNLPYREPLSGDLPAWLRDACAPAPRPEPATPEPLVLEIGPRTIVFAGADAGPVAEDVSYAAGWPLIAEVVSGARFGRLVVHGYRELLADPDLGGRIQRVVVFGRPTLSREGAALLARADVEVVAVGHAAAELDLNGTTVHTAAARPAGPDDRTWLGAWMRASHALAVDLDPPAPDADGLSSPEPHTRLGALAAEVQVFRAALDRRTLVDALWRATWPHDRIVFGASRLVRVADRVLGGKRVRVHANRGLAGIDGTVSTAMGVALASQSDGAPGVTRVLVGDLTLLHDIGAFALPEGESAPRIQVVVGNDGGGTVFDGLEVAQTADAAAARRVLYTPHSVDLERLAAAYAWEHHRVTTRSALDQLLASPSAGRHLIEVPLER